jgi:hypothetical protein
MITVYAFSEEQGVYYRLRLTPRQARRLDNGHLFSIGLEIGKDISRDRIVTLKGERVSRDDWNHSGCQSSCTRRGDDRCGW